MRKTRNVDDLTEEEIRAIDEFRLSDSDRVHFKTAKEAIEWLHGE